MAEDLPFIRGSIGDRRAYQSPRGGSDEKPQYTRRDDPKGHMAAILEKLKRLSDTASTRPPRVEGATREMIAVLPTPGSDFSIEALASKDDDVRIAAIREDSGAVLLDAPSTMLPHLEKKAREFADDKKVGKSGLRRNEPVIAPIESIRLAAVDDLAAARFLASRPDPTHVRWFEFACRGGYRDVEPMESSRAQMATALGNIGSAIVHTFVAAERTIFFARVQCGRIEELISSVDCIDEFDLAPPDRRTWLTIEFGGPSPKAGVISKPAANAPSVVVLDSGIAEKHPLLSPAVLSATSSVPNDTSPADMDGHGTAMSGVALFEDIIQAAEAGHPAPHWIQSSRIIVTDNAGSAAEENKEQWPPITEAAVKAAEHPDFGVRRRVYALAISAPLDHPPRGTTWSHAIDQLAFRDGGRVFCVAIGDATIDRSLVEGYPLMNLQQLIDDPAQAFNALTIGAYTEKTELPPDADLQNYAPVAPRGGVSPHTRAGVPGAAIKPDVVFEGGNVGDDGALANSNLWTMVQPTTNADFVKRPFDWMAMTSGASANASRFTAEVWAANSDFRPETVRGLVVHAASWTGAMISQLGPIDERLQLCGYGVPSTTFAKGCANERATVIVEGLMPNGLFEEVPKKKKPKKSTTKTTEPRIRRRIQFFEMPVPEEQLLQQPNLPVELRVTLSYFAEPHTTGRRVERGLDLRWNMQGPTETAEKFRRRMNKLDRAGKEDFGESFDWDIGITRRSRGTVQSDRWRGPASLLAGSKLIAVYPVLGWWERRDALRTLEMNFSLIVTIVAGGIDIYTPIKQAVEVTVTA